MQVVEHGVLALETFLKESDPKAHFGSVLARLERMVQKEQYEHLPDDIRPFKQFMIELLPQLHAVKDAWRDKVSHVGTAIIPIKQFSPEQALEVHAASLALMNKLAKEPWECIDVDRASSSCR